MKSNKTIIQFQHADIGYKNKILLENIDITISKGEKILLLGSNGSGKTTFLKTILGILPIQKGKVNFYYQSISYVPQNKDHSIFDFPLSIEDTLKLTYPLWYSKQKQKKEIQEVLKKTNLIDKKNQLLRECSGGELQRMYIARALLRQSDVLILDEPFTAIDIQNKQSFFSLLKRIYKDFICTIILTSHELNSDIENFFDIKLILINKKIQIKT